MDQNEITLFLTMTRAAQAAYGVDGMVEGRITYRITAGYLKCDDGTVDRGFKVQIIEDDDRRYFL